MAEALINLLLEQLVSVAFDHTKEAVKLIFNAETEVQKFSSNLRAIQAVLEDAEKQQVEKASVRNWLDGLKDVSYEMVDVLDEWNTEILKQKVMGVPTEKKRTLMKKVCLSIPLNCFCFAQVNKATHLYRIATVIKQLNEKLTLIAAQKEQFEFHQSSTRISDERLIKPLETSSFVNISKIFGREEATADLLSKLLSDSSEEGKEIPVIPLVGMGGMGKTTLAQLAYNNENVKTYFEKRVWVCVSDPFDGVKIAKAIISGTDNRIPESTLLQDALQCMSSCLAGMRCLIVLDDVWNEDPEKWESLKLPLIMESCGKGSKIMVTTRKEKVAEIMGATTLMIHLEKLSDESSLAMFNSIAYLRREEDEANRFGAIGEKIAKKCDGLPLAVRTLGSLLRFKKKREEWQKVLDSKIWLLKEVEQQVFQPLLLSYNELAPTTKRCLLYCVTFPKDYSLDKQHLIEMWMSQDYLTGEDYEEKERTGQNVFDALVMRSFFQNVEEEVDYSDMIITISCKMHDIVHDFVKFLNKNECFMVEPKEADGAIVMTSEQVRHLTLMFASLSSPLSDFISVVNCKKLRTLSTFDSRMNSTDIKLISLVKCLRTLNLRHNGIEELPEEMGELIHLRYLDLSEIYLNKLPDSLGNLYNLQTLRLIRCRSLKRLPENMGNLVNLSHLHNKDCDSLEYLPRGMARLTSLQTMNQCTVIHDDDSEGLKLEDLGSLDQLKGSLTVTIKGILNENATEAQKARLCNKKLSYLGLDFTKLARQSHEQALEALRPHQDLESLYIIGYCGSTSPSWLESFQNLRSLHLMLWEECECLPPLGKLPSLEQLFVWGMTQVKTVGDEFLGTQTSSSSSAVFFPKLKNLTFGSMTELEQWKGVGGNAVTIMPCLEYLYIYECPKLVSLPLFLQNTPVSKIYIQRCRRSIIIPVMPNNCEVIDAIEEPDVNERNETDSQIDEEVVISQG